MLMVILLRKHIFCSGVIDNFPFYFVGEDYEEAWKELTKMLNATLGPKKTIEEWKTVSGKFVFL